MLPPPPSISKTFIFPKWNSIPLNNNSPFSSPLSPCKWPVYFLSPWIWLFQVPQIRDHTVLCFGDWLISLSIMSSRFVHVAVCVRISFLFKAELHSMYVYITFCLSIHPSMNTWVASTFWLLWIMLLWALVYNYLPDLYDLRLSVLSSETNLNSISQPQRPISNFKTPLSDVASVSTCQGHWVQLYRLYPTQGHLGKVVHWGEIKLELHSPSPAAMRVNLLRGWSIFWFMKRHLKG